MGCTADVHGTRTAYWKGCRCPEARELERAYKAAYRKRRYLAKHPLRVPAHGAHRRIRALQALGWSLRDINVELGCANRHTGFASTLLGEATILASTLERVIAVYDRLSMTPGPSNLARAKAAAKGYPPPLAWDEDAIDDPRACPRPWLPDHPHGRPRTRDALVAELEFLRSCGCRCHRDPTWHHGEACLCGSLSDWAERLGVSAAALTKAVERAAHDRTRAPERPATLAG
jgi:hypothetical protein